jgi:hypothetical protein
MLKGLTIDNMVIGGPAHNTGLLAKGDVIIAVDGLTVNEETVHAALLGDDLPGTSVVLTVRKVARNRGDEPGNIAEQVLRNADAVLQPFFERVSFDGSPNKSELIREVVVVRMATEKIADRRHMFELFTDLKVPSILMLNPVTALKSHPASRRNPTIGKKDRVQLRGILLSSFDRSYFPMSLSLNPSR